ncbi:phage tail protein [Vibrio fluvialis]|uniref:phage tail protein n=1 Tax=Vibrio fluvialis TaxID=676 RepID=UPI001EEA198D|nr:phage tail protein [Vibrio fluvialis]MCG6350637.1 phage tail protein [Vibrio fluvialis]
MLKHFISSTTGEYIKSGKFAVNMGFTTSQPLPDIELAENEYFAMLDAGGKVQYWPDDANCTWQVKTRFEKVSAYNKADKVNKIFDDYSLVTDDFTLKAPNTQFDVWNEALGNWQTDLQAQYEAEVQRVANVRENLYTQIVDRLNNEAKMIRRVEGDEAKAAECEAQADAAYLKIRAENPWPSKP